MPDYKQCRFSAWDAMGRPLGSAAAYIGQHGHLPGVPSAQEVVESGVDLVKMNAKLLEKIEELTLYCIQLEKAGQVKEGRLDGQQARLDLVEKLVKQLLAKKSNKV
ncbi:hypothetical protein [Spirosoma flavum]|uniref:Uncharacterized protein n=1 Tax=Spirosoma flavum TaxID=2048557 RepID=A0ABW6AKF2_9BACT